MVVAIAMAVVTEGATDRRRSNGIKSVDATKDAATRTTTRTATTDRRRTAILTEAATIRPDRLGKRAPMAKMVKSKVERGIRGCGYRST